MGVGSGITVEVHDRPQGDAWMEEEGGAGMEMTPSHFSRPGMRGERGPFVTTAAKPTDVSSQSYTLHVNLHHTCSKCTFGLQTLEIYNAAV